MSARDTFSTYQAKARFSEILRRVREGRVVTITYHGEPVAEIRPLAPARGLEARLARLRERGALVAPVPDAPAPAPVARRPGALTRFLEERRG